MGRDSSVASWGCTGANSSASRASSVPGFPQIFGSLRSPEDANASLLASARDSGCVHMQAPCIASILELLSAGPGSAVCCLAADALAALAGCAPESPEVEAVVRAAFAPFTDAERPGASRAAVARLAQLMSSAGDPRADPGPHPCASTQVSLDVMVNVLVSCPSSVQRPGALYLLLELGSGGDVGSRHSRARRAQSLQLSTWLIAL